MMFTDADDKWMQRALTLAERGLNTTHPNPRVGCVLVKGGHVVGEGWHVKAGDAHAEVNALRQAGDAARGATAYVTLEPCSHHGRTGPCADALIAAGVSEVVMAMSDPNPLVNGQGKAKLIASGIAVREGLLEVEARQLNAGFIKRMQQGLPLVRVKLGMSLDGRTALANGVSQWITSEQARADVQQWRARSSAILTGIGTVLADDPQLTVRDPNIEMLGRQPLRVICDTQLRTPPQAILVQQSGTLIYTAQSPKSLGQAEIHTVTTADQQLDLRAVLTDLARRGCNEVLVEAGATLTGRLIEQQLVDELLVYVAPVLLGHDARPLVHLPKLEAMQDCTYMTLLSSQSIGSDIRLHYQINWQGHS